MTQLISDILLCFRADADSGEVKVSALVTQLEDGESRQYWANQGRIMANGEFHVMGNGIVIAAKWQKAGKELYRARLNGTATLPDGKPDPTPAHHTIVGEATVNGESYVVFPDRAGQRLSLKPDTRTQGEAVAVPGLLD